MRISNFVHIRTIMFSGEAHLRSLLRLQLLQGHSCRQASPGSLAFLPVADMTLRGRRASSLASNTRCSGITTQLGSDWRYYDCHFRLKQYEARVRGLSAVHESILEAFLLGLLSHIGASSAHFSASFSALCRSPLLSKSSSMSST